MKVKEKDKFSLSFFMPMEKLPTTTAQEKKIRIIHKNGKTHPMFYDPPKTKQSRKILREALAPFVPEEPIIKKPICLYVEWLFPLTKTANEGDWKITRPDTDNLQKMLKDVMTEIGFWKDDALVCMEHIEKQYSADSGIYISISEL